MSQPLKSFHIAQLVTVQRSAVGEKNITGHVLEIADNYITVSDDNAVFARTAIPLSQYHIFAAKPTGDQS